MSRRRLRWAVVSAAALTAIAAALVVAMVTSGSSNARPVPKLAATGGDMDATAAQRQRGGGEAVTFEAYKAATRMYPAASVPLRWLENTQATYSRIASRTPKAPPNPALTDLWQLYGPQVYATYPGLLDFGGVGYHASARIVALAISNTCNANSCVMYAGPNAGGVWKTTNALDPDPTWTQMAVGDFAQANVGDIIIDPTDFTEQTIYVGTGEPNACSSGCPAGVGLYKSTNGGASFFKLPGTCVSNGTYTCISPGKDSFLGRGISEIVVDPSNPNHLYVGSATAVRGLSHVIGLGGQRRFDEPGVNPTGLYESFDGGATFTPNWVPNPGAQGSLLAAPGRRGVNDIGLDPNNTAVVYAAAFDVGLWRRCPTAVAACGSEAYSGPTNWKKVFAERKPADGGSDVGRVQFDITTAPNNASKTRIYLTDGRGSATAPFSGESGSSFWRTDNANQTAAALLATEPAGAAQPPGYPAGGNPAGTVYNGWQILTANTTQSPYWPTHNFCAPQCWYDQDVMTPHNPPRPDEVYVIGDYEYGEMTCRTRGTNFCSSGISNTRAILFSNTAGDLDPAFNNRTFTDMTWDAQNKPGTWCAYPGISTCDVSQDAQHPDQHEIVVNPNRPSQFFEASDGGIVRSDGRYTNMSRLCDFRAQPDAGIPGLTGNALTQCRRLLSRVPTLLDHTNKDLGSTLQFINVHANPTNPCKMIGGTQDNGTWMPGPYNSGCDSNEWFTKIYGDGGWAGFDSHPDDPALPPSSRTGNSWVFNQFTSPTIDANFRNGDTEKWVVVSGPIANAEAVGFYQPQIPDPNPPMFGAARTHPIFVAQNHVWRSWAFGAGRPISNPQQVVPDVPYYEANCPEFFTSFAQANCGDFQPLGGPAGLNQPGDLTGTVYGSDRMSQTGIGRGVSAITRRGADFDTMWAATGHGRLFVTFNANATDPASVVWYRVDSLPTAGGNPCTSTTEPNCSPDRFIAGIYPDPANVNVAYVAYSGYNAATPTTIGHVYRVILTRAAGVPTNAAFNNLNVEMGLSAYPTQGGVGDLPTNDVVMDDLTRNLYVATDFGVLKGTPSSGSTTTSTYTWGTTAGMPRYEVVHLALVGGQRDACRNDLPAAAGVCGDLLLAATHSQGIWVNHLG